MPEHRGRGLGRAVCLAVLHAAARLGHQAISLTTDDPRRPAIRPYLGLGFEPWPLEPTAPARWETVMNRLTG